MIIVVLDDRQRSDGSDADAQFLLAFADNALFQGFASFLFPAGKLPVTAQGNPFGATADQHFVIPLDNGDGDGFKGGDGRVCHGCVSLSDRAK